MTACNDEPEPEPDPDPDAGVAAYSKERREIELGVREPGRLGDLPAGAFAGMVMDDAGFEKMRRRRATDMQITGTGGMPIELEVRDANTCLRVTREEMAEALRIRDGWLHAAGGGNEAAVLEARCAVGYCSWLEEKEKRLLAGWRPGQCEPEFPYDLSGWAGKIAVPAPLLAAFKADSGRRIPRSHAVWLANYLGWVRSTAKKKRLDPLKTELYKSAGGASRDTGMTRGQCRHAANYWVACGVVTVDVKKQDRQTREYSHYSLNPADWQCTDGGIVPRGWLAAEPFWTDPVWHNPHYARITGSLSAAHTLEYLHYVACMDGQEKAVSVGARSEPDISALRDDPMKYSGMGTLALTAAAGARGVRRRQARVAERLSLSSQQIRDARSLMKRLGLGGDTGEKGRLVVNVHAVRDLRWLCRSTKHDVRP